MGAWTAVGALALPLALTRGEPKAGAIRPAAAVGASAGAMAAAAVAAGALALTLGADEEMGAEEANDEDTDRDDLVRDLVGGRSVGGGWGADFEDLRRSEEGSNPKSARFREFPEDSGLV